MVKLRSLLGITRHSYALLGVFFLTCFLIVYIWWPLVVDYVSYFDGRFPWYYYIDWLLLGIFIFMSASIMVRADLKNDVLIVFVGLCGGLVIESWGTQTNLWHYYTAERPPLWIIPAWPIASLSIDRVSRFLHWITAKAPERVFDAAYWLGFTFFGVLFITFVYPTFNKSYTWIALFICLTLVLTTKNRRYALLVFIAGTGLGYFLELWGTTRECWMYYTNQTPPVFAVFAHGMAAVAFWRTLELIRLAWSRAGKSVKLIITD